MPRTPSSTPTPPIRVERAACADWRALHQLEVASFAGDRLSIRSWKSLLASASATVLVVRLHRAGPLAGAVVVLRRAGTSVARLYSIAVARHARGRGVSAALLDDAARRMRDAGAAVLRLETRVDNVVAQRLFAGQGFVGRGRKPHYYEDGADALLYQRPLQYAPAAALVVEGR